MQLLFPNHSGHGHLHPELRRTQTSPYCLMPTSGPEGLRTGPSGNPLRTSSPRLHHPRPTSAPAAFAAIQQPRSSAPRSSQVPPFSRHIRRQPKNTKTMNHDGDTSFERFLNVHRLPRGQLARPPFPSLPLVGLLGHRAPNPQSACVEVFTAVLLHTGFPSVVFRVYTE